MPKFTVHADITYTDSVEVEADTEEQAHELALPLFVQDAPQGVDVTADDVEISGADQEDEEEEGVNTYTVEVVRSMRCTVEVKAESANEARGYVDRVSFPLPPLEEWSGDKDFEYVVMDADGNMLIDADGNETEEN